MYFKVTFCIKEPLTTKLKQLKLLQVTGKLTHRYMKKFYKFKNFVVQNTHIL